MEYWSVGLQNFDHPRSACGRARLSERAASRPAFTVGQTFYTDPGTLVVRRTARSDGPDLEISHSIIPLLHHSVAESRTRTISPRL